MMECIFNKILPIEHDYPSSEKSLHTESGECSCKPLRFITIKKPYRVHYTHWVLRPYIRKWYPRENVSPLPIVEQSKRTKNTGTITMTTIGLRDAASFIRPQPDYKGEFDPSTAKLLREQMEGIYDTNDLVGMVTRS